MKGTKLMRLIAMLTAMMMVFSLASCSGGNSGAMRPSNEETDPYGEDVSEEQNDSDASETKYRLVEGVNVLEDTNLRYVMIYNPGIYDENDNYDSSKLKTGFLGSQVDVSSFRADGLEEVQRPNTIPQNMMDYPVISTDQVRADVEGVEYTVGDIVTFYAPNIYGTGTLDRQATQFICAYEGRYCYVWNTGELDLASIESVGREFDTNIYNQEISMFGPARFDGSAGENGKINIMLCPFADGYAGVFYPADLYATGELTDSTVSTYKPNLNHDMVFVNSIYMAPPYQVEDAYGTLAHEFQHLLNMSAGFNTYGRNNIFCRTWINECMSEYVQSEFYPYASGSSDVESLMSSGFVRSGQSLYNFTTSLDYTAWDSGPYGSVYVFSQYLEDLAGDDVFSNFYLYWRDSYSPTLCEAEALVNSVPSYAKEEIDNLIAYPDSVSFVSDEEEWMSKLTLDFYLSMLSKEGNLDAYSGINNYALLYDEINGAEIEGGGRIIVAVDGRFEVPQDAEEGLVYVGLDANFQPVTAFAYN